MPRILRTRASRSDYDEIWSFIAVHDLNAADRLMDQLDATLESLPQHLAWDARWKSWV